MKINPLNTNKSVQHYNEVKRKSEKQNVKKNSDTIEISDIGKSMSTYSLNDKLNMSPEKIDSIRKEVSSGTYSRDSRVVASKMLDIMKGRGV